MNSIFIIRSSTFVGMLLVLSLLQFKIPSRPFTPKRFHFTISNLALVLFNNVFLALIPLVPYQAALISQSSTYGLFNQLSLPLWGNLIAGLLLLDLLIYFQHRLFHRIPFLWRLHSMHHIDPMLDTSSGLRFHPLEILISNFIKVGAVLLLGIAPLTVAVFEILLNALAMFNHSNIAIPDKLEHRINKILITPALHTIHHSKRLKETNSNYGFSVPWWDKLFHTFIAEGKHSQENIHIGTLPMPDQKYQLFPGMLIQPFLRKSKD